MQAVTYPQAVAMTDQARESSKHTYTSRDLVERLRAWAPLVSSGYEVPAACQCMAEAADSIEQLEAENATLKALVRGWHYLAVGPDEMGDYYTHKALIKASEPYASPALVALGDKTND